MLLAIDLQHRLVQVRLHAVLAVIVCSAERQRLGIAPAEVLRQVNAVVGALALFAEHVHLIMGKRTLLDELLDAMVTHHAIADDDQRFFLDRGDERIHGQSSVTGLLCLQTTKKAPATVSSCRRLCLGFSNCGARG